MYFWNVSKLAEDLREGRVEEKERFKYYLATSLLWTLGTQPFLYYGRTFKILDVVGAAALVIVTIVGITVCYRANRTGDNTDFIGRMICLSWPITIKLLVVFGIVGILVGFAFGALGSMIEALSGQEMLGDLVVDILGEVVSVIYEICVFWLIYKYLTLISHAKEAERLD